MGDLEVGGNVGEDLTDEVLVELDEEREDLLVHGVLGEQGLHNHLLGKRDVLALLNPRQLHDPWLIQSTPLHNQLTEEVNVNMH